MPRIPSEYLNTAFYLYDSVEAAEAGSEAGGTGFFVAVPASTVRQRHFIYAVSNRHVVRGGASVIRVNRKDGKCDIFGFEPHEWDVHPAGDDLAIIPFPLNQNIHECGLVAIEMFATEADVGLDDAPITVGDDLFQIGRFCMIGGEVINQPVARFGNLSSLLITARGSGGFLQESLGAEVHSVSGFSGSPVFVLRSQVVIGSTMMEDNPVRLLGVCWAHVPLDEEVLERIVAVPMETLRDGERRQQYVNLNSGMDLVVPAWKLAELLNTPKQVRYRHNLLQMLPLSIDTVNYTDPSPSLDVALCASPGPSFLRVPPREIDPEET